MVERRRGAVFAPGWCGRLAKVGKDVAHGGTSAARRSSSCSGVRRSGRLPPGPGLALSVCVALSVGVWRQLDDPRSERSTVPSWPKQEIAELLDTGTASAVGYFNQQSENHGRSAGPKNPQGKVALRAAPIRLRRGSCCAKWHVCCGTGGDSARVHGAIKETPTWSEFDRCSVPRIVSRLGTRERWAAACGGSGTPKLSLTRLDEIQAGLKENAVPGYALRDSIPARQSPRSHRAF